MSFPRNEYQAQDMMCFLDYPDEHVVAQRIIMNDLAIHCADQARTNGIRVSSVVCTIKARVRQWGLQAKSLYRSYVLSLV